MRDGCAKIQSRLSYLICIVPAVRRSIELSMRFTVSSSRLSITSVPSSLSSSHQLNPTDAPSTSPRSDCSSARSGGDLGFFSRGAMQKAFEDATYALPVGGLSDVVSSDSGLHVILRTA